MSNQAFTRQADYAKTLRGFLPQAAFQPNPDRVVVLVINLVILVLGWGIASDLDRWISYTQWLYLPFTLIMANSVIVLLFSIHEIMHSASIKKRPLLHVLALLALTPLWMPPTLWRAVHNQVHHTHTNSLKDPDRRYLTDQPMTWGKWIHALIIPSLSVNRVLMVLGMMFAWGIHTFRNLTSVLLFNSDTVNYVPASFSVKTRDRYKIAIEFAIMLALHFCVLRFLEFDPLKLLLSYFLPIGLGYAGVIFYIYTNHMACPITEVNDPLVNTTSIRVPAFLDALHFNFSYHAEHHIFPSLNSDYYPLVQDLIQTHYPDQANYLISAQAAWQKLLEVPEEYHTPSVAWTATNEAPIVTVPKRAT